MGKKSDHPPLQVRVWGDLACFTRPEMKVERVSYPVPTPSAARGILEAIFWKPQFRWQVQEIWVLKPVRYLSILRNEVTARATRDGDRAAGFAAPAFRAQRHTLALRDVDYVIKADVQVHAEVDDDPAKFRDQFRRRVRKGACFATPFLGCREFSAAFGEVEGSEDPYYDRENPTEELGSMLYDIDYLPDRSGRRMPSFFNAVMKKGILRVPPPDQVGRAA